MITVTLSVLALIIFCVSYKTGSKFCDAAGMFLAVAALGNLYMTGGGL